MESFLNELKNKMQKAFDVVHQDFATVRTGKASPTLVENIVINAYGGTTPLKVLELATIHAQDSQTLLITPFDKTVIAEIEKGISNSNTGLNPIIDGNVLRINLPPLTQERRLEFIKLVKQKAENGKVMVRQIRHEGMEDAKKKAEGEGISEDEITRLEKEIQKLTDEYMEKIDKLCQEKEEELMRL